MIKKTILAATFSLALIAPALAIDFSQELLTFDGKSFVDQSGQPAPQILGTVAENSLLQTAQGDTIDDKNRRFWLAEKIHSHPKDANMSAEEIALVKKAIGTYQPIAIMGQAIRLIDPASAPK
jgi:hypothetical protein